MTDSQTLFVGRNVIRLDTVNSTNTYATNQLAKSRLPEGTAFVAAEQTQGRGYSGNEWQSEKGKNLLLSVVLYPGWLGVGEQFWLSMAMGLGVRDAVSGLQDSGWRVSGSRDHVECANPKPVTRQPEPSVTIKWPNDLYLGDRKAGGMLIENTLSGGKIQSSIVGIGLNVNQLAFPGDLPNPTSLALAAGRPFDLDVVADALFERLEQRYLQLKAGRRAELKSDYLAALYRFGAASEFVRAADGAVFSGTIRGVTEAGWLQLETEAGLECFEVKQLRFAP